MRFLRNTWYVAALDTEVGRDMLARTILGEAVVMYRKENGEAVAIQDRCPHRFAPLSRGTLVGDNVQCAYHGLQYDCSGKCVLNPHGDGKIPQAARVKNYPFIQRYGLMWIWMGDQEKVDAELIPAYYSHFDSPDWKTVRGHSYQDANYQLIADNLLDLSHDQFLHANYHRKDTFLTTPHEVFEEGRQVVSRRQVLNSVASDAFAGNLPDPDLLVDQWKIMKWEAPGYFLLDVGVKPSKGAEGVALRKCNAHILTPATETSTNYFFINARNYQRDDEKVDAQIREWQRVGFGEQDKPMIEAIQKVMGSSELFDLNPILLSVDGAAIRARRALAKLLKAQEETTTIATESAGR
ncbi:MAG: aromatic ring-hydroxylating dioxygenase subunit alpha [Herbaspirillum sp.]|jgi:phenylpropionate dioxygenase-like ring-hydroxylating dioxygenase large terminal subunit|nr:aromatic ring-hydroxylating dioxygenase subunit alpha [Herbaspirillum sp.]